MSWRNCATRGTAALPRLMNCSHDIRTSARVSLLRILWRRGLKPMVYCCTNSFNGNQFHSLSSTWKGRNSISTFQGLQVKFPLRCPLYVPFMPFQSGPGCPGYPPIAKPFEIWRIINTDFRVIDILKTENPLSLSKHEWHEAQMFAQEHHNGTQQCCTPVTSIL